MEIQMIRIPILWSIMVTVLVTCTGYGQTLTNIQAESDGQRIVVKYDLEDLKSNSYAKISLSFGTIRGQPLRPSSLSGNTLVKSSGQNYMLVWDAARDIPGYEGFVEPILQMDVVKFKYLEYLQNEGLLSDKSYGQAAWRNLLLPGLGIQYASSGRKGRVQSWMFAALAVSALSSHLITRSQYQDYMNATGLEASKVAYTRANTTHRVAWTLGISASLWYLTDQISLSSHKKYFRKSKSR
jgi:hypothetical protein